MHSQWLIIVGVLLGLINSFAVWDRASAESIANETMVDIVNFASTIASGRAASYTNISDNREYVMFDVEEGLKGCKPGDKLVVVDASYTQWVAHCAESSQPMDGTAVDQKPEHPRFYILLIRAEQSGLYRLLRLYCRRDGAVVLGAMASATKAPNADTSAAEPPYSPEQILNAWGDHAAGRISQEEFDEIIKASDAYLKSQGGAVIDVGSPPDIH
ncbi:MAG TPA: hypothetical protein PKE12_13940 [Kiritimatiellia bacterium]|nr:hypothetical protein [Kiritimatiellia bacterium]